MYTEKDKVNIVAKYNAEHKTYYRYLPKYDQVIDDFTRAWPQSFTTWLTKSA